MVRKVFSKSVIIAALIVFAAGMVLSAPLPVLRMATTTSTDNTGLLDYLAPVVTEKLGIDLQWVSVGSGAAIKHGENGDVDIILTHDPAAEDNFEKSGAGVNRKYVMYNDYIIIGPKDDPAAIKGLSTAEAFKKIANSGLAFASRADKSGTHSAELAQWKHAGIEVPDKEQWYLATGQGMLQTINIAAERKGYTLTDRGTYITYESKGSPELIILVEGDESLYNQYSIMTVNPAKHPGTNVELAKKLTDWIISPETQDLIAKFKVQDKQLFFPNAAEKNRD
ncbi:MAG: substrate-binding domain-containing protein [Synergistaceae bacterium]|nr:substrate-binding domain-containing protein [Synergistaceae bacterium]